MAGVNPYIQKTQAVKATKPFKVTFVDEATGGWGHITIDHIEFTNQKPAMAVADSTRDIVVSGRYLFLPVKIGGDMAVLKGMMKIMLERERSAPGTIFDHEFINEYTTGYRELAGPRNPCGTECTWARALPR